MFRPARLLSLPLLLALGTSAPAAALYNLTDLSARQEATLNNRGEVAYRFGPWDSRDWGLYRSLHPTANEVRYTSQGEPASSGYSHFKMGEDGSLYGLRSVGPTVVGGNRIYPTEAIRMSPEGVVTRIGPAGATYSGARAANAGGLVVGTHNTPGEYSRPFLHRPATATTPARTEDLGRYGGYQAYPVALNEAGQFLVNVAFEQDEASWTEFRLVQPDGTATPIPTPEGASSYWLADLNDQGVAVGTIFHRDGSMPQAATWTESGWTALSMPGRPEVKVTNANAINNNGDLLLDTSIGSVVVRDGQWLALNDLFDDPENRWRLFKAKAINDLGQILAEGVVEWGEGRNRHDSTVLLTPKSLPAPIAPAAVPEPATLAGFLALAALLAGRRLRS